MYTLIAYKENVDVSACGNHVASYRSDFRLFSHLSHTDYINKLAELIDEEMMWAVEDSPECKWSFYTISNAQGLDNTVTSDDNIRHSTEYSVAQRRANTIRADREESKSVEKAQCSMGDGI